MNQIKSGHWILPAVMCRVDDEIVGEIRRDESVTHLVASLCLAVLVGSSLYGFVFGIWHSFLQGALSAVKMPVMIFAVSVSSALINYMLAQVLGAGLSFRQVFLCMLLSFSITAILLGAMSPVLLFFSAQCPGRYDKNAVDGYRILLLLNTAVVALCGMIGNVKLYQLLERLTGSGLLALKVVVLWIFAAGLVGCELSWVLSPFLARPDIPLPLYNPNAFSSNFFEYLYMTSYGRL